MDHVEPSWLFDLPLDEIKKAAKRHGIDPVLVATIVKVESGGNPLAARYEPGFRWTTAVNQWANTLGITPNTELVLQSTSMGVMQIMGATARDLSFSGHLSELYKVDVGLEWGCQYLKKKLFSYSDPADVYAAYNAGDVRKTNGLYDNQRAVDNFMTYYRQVQHLAGKI